ncbi:FtsX-like permease family protein [Neolewinella antarctica]|uniref:ABC transport system permease protein n=1 Tax=Neolewinella antarctica TaxID=442734 RepID=A0ABX0X8N7_9BACT|nr:FtsX-like permease family protein [Neolewinella antarctica]NJC25615.1 putative ABC transport system permease protein [Neolewinella antarctica]
MKSFDVSAAVAQWRSQLISAGSDPSFLEELESGLYDRYDHFLLSGLPPAEAFARAREKVGDVPRVAVAEYGKAARPSGFALGYLLPSYLKTGLRTLRSRPIYNLINYLCLTIGIVTAAIALLYLRSELRYDATTPNAQAKYRLGMQYRSQGYSMIGFSDYNQTDADEQLERVRALTELPGILTAVQFQTFPERQLIRLREGKFEVENLLETNTPAAFADFFGYRFLSGSATAFAAAPNTAALTAGEAEKIFGPDWRNQNIIGQPLTIDTFTYTIAGVLADPAPNTHFDFSIALHRERIAYWGSRLYVEADAAQNAATLAAAIDDNFAKINASLAQQDLFGGVIVQPLRSIHLGSDLLYELKPPGKPAYLYVIGIMALLVLLLTISNYTNLAVAMHTGRSREIGMRKVFGAGDGQIAGQFLLEAALLGLLAFPLVMTVLYFLLPRFDALMGTAIGEGALRSPVVWGIVVAATLVIGSLAGLYPAVYLSRQPIIGLFDHRMKSGGGGAVSTRKVIITLQFTLLIALCSLTLLVNRQLNYMQTKDLGFDRDRVLYVNVNADSSRFATFREEVLRLPSVTSVGAGTPLGQQDFNQLTYKLEGQSEVFDDAYNVYMDFQSLALLDIETSIPELVADPEQAPARLVLINNTLAERLKNRYGLTDADLVGRTIIEEPEYTDEETGEVGFPYEIYGTFGDINVFSLREQVGPMLMTVSRNPRYVYWAAVRYREDSPTEILKDVRTVYDGMNLDPIFTHAFLEANLEDLYEDESRISTLSTYFSLVAFGLALLGLIALTAYLTTLRQREIGIRRILGASQWSILRRYNGEYLPLLAVALLIATPLSWLAVDEWLAGFAYRIDVGPWVFLLAAGLTLLVTVLVVSMVTVLAMRVLPARVLSGE